MVISNIFNIDDVLLMEHDVIQQINSIEKSYFKEDVAQYLYEQWKKNHEDTRILLYIFPLIQSLMIKNIQILDSTKLECNEIFNILCIKLMKALEKYNTTRGKLFTYFTIICQYRIYDLCKPQRQHYSLEEYDAPIDDYAVYKLLDFQLFITKIAPIEGITANKIINAIITIITSDKIICQDQKALVLMIERLTKLPEIIILNYLVHLKERYTHSVID